MNKKIKLAIFFGGKSEEHDVSMISAQNIVGVIDKKKYEITLVGIDKKGGWFSFSAEELLLEKVVFKNELKKTEVISMLEKVDVAFPILHGPFGEDGSIQGLFKIMGVPFVGSNVLGSAVGMDKDVCKRLLKEAGLPVSDFVVFRKNEKDAITFANVEEKLGLPFFVKPANMGSSVGISKVKNEAEFEKAIGKAFGYDEKVVIEEFVKGKEIECAVLGNEELFVSGLGEIIPNHEFYSYEAKYLDENGAQMAIPANVSDDIAFRIQEMSKKVFKVLCARGLSRVDFFLTNDNRIFVNEINTMPGFTKISMYPKLMQEAGVSYTELIDKLIELALDDVEAQKISR